ncbi:MAG: hypothetical protein HZB99_00590 [Candidatus Harrisonbacteria bacterium]|nr:hypothetical protein [Candidatus Harrisonbacteria bacterium]
MSGFNFLKAVIKDYKVGAITVSSKYVVQSLMKELGSDFKYIVEYGAGDGIVTKEILKRLSADGRLVAFELNKDFAAELRKINDNRLKVLNDDVIVASRDLKKLGLPRIDAVVSGIPFTVIKPKERSEVILNTYSAINKGGIFLVYQYTPLVLPILKKFFKKVDLSFEPRNFLPYFIMRAKK